jgi:hypothetical protein
MRVFALLGGGLLVLVGMTYVLLSGHVPQQARAVLGMSKAEPPKPAAVTEPPKPAKPEKRARKIRTTPVDAEVQIVSWRPLPETSETTQRKSKTFPEPGNFSSGMLRADVERLYGAPTLSVVQTRSGRLLQRYIYVSPEKSSTTMAIIEDGRVVNAASLPN